MDAKHALAARIVTDFHSAEGAEAGAARFRKVVQQGQVPEDMPEHAMPEGVRDGSSLRVDKLIRALGLAGSGKEAVRKLKEGAVEVNGDRCSEMSLEIDAEELVLRVGKKWARVR